MYTIPFPLPLTICDLSVACHLLGSQILSFRHGLWSGPVKTRKHSISKIYPFGDNSNEVMLYGTVDYVLKNGKDVTVEWAGRAVLTEERDEKWKMHFYQVYMDSAPVAAAVKE